MNEETKQLTTIPFPGLYCSMLSGALGGEEEMTAEGMAENEEIPGATAEQIGAVLWEHVDYGTAHGIIAKAWAEYLADAINENLPDGFAPLALTFESMSSPREYNFTTDRIFCHLPAADVARMRAAVSDDTLAECTVDRFTSRSGFISFYGTDLAEWDRKPLAEWDHNEVGTLLAAFIAQHYQGGERQLENDVYGQMHEGNVFSRAIDEALDFDALKIAVTANMREETTNG